MQRLLEKGWSAENIAFGMGGALLQKVNRDTLRFAMKANARQDSAGVWHGLSKSPATDPSKASKRGRLAVVREGARFSWCPLDDLGARENLLTPVWRNGELLRRTMLAEVRKRARA